MTDNDVLCAIASVPEPYGLPILDHLNRNIKPNWLTRRFPVLQAHQGISIGKMYAHLYRLERAGLVWSEFGSERLPERGFRRRRYYYLTDAGKESLGLRGSGG